MEIFIVCVDEKQVYCALQPVSPFFKGEFDSQQLRITDVVVSFHHDEFVGIDGTLMEYSRRPLPL